MLSSSVRSSTSSGVNHASSCDSSLTVNVVGVGDQQEADVVVLVGVFDQLAVRVVAGRDFVDVDVERHHDAVDRHDVEPREARFFAGFAEGDFFDVPLAVGVAAELQPAIELAVVGEQRAAAIGRENPGGARDVAGPAGAVEAIRVGLDEPTNAVDHRAFGREGVAVASQHVEKGLAGHGSGVGVAGTWS